MNITNVDVTRGPAGDGVLAYCTITIDGEFVVKDIKVIKTDKGVIVSMPNRAHKVRCVACGRSIDCRDNYCGRCGGEMARGHYTNREARKDIAHPITTDARLAVEEAVLKAVLPQ